MCHNSKPAAEEHSLLASNTTAAVAVLRHIAATNSPVPSALTTPAKPASQSPSFYTLTPPRCLSAANSYLTR